jgi:hypothetical protein
MDPNELRKTYMQMQIDIKQSEGEISVLNSKNKDEIKNRDEVIKMIQKVKS